MKLKDIAIDQTLKAKIGFVVLLNNNKTLMGPLLDPLEIYYLKTAYANQEQRHFR
jgi:hypothetical protein